MRKSNHEAIRYLLLQNPDGLTTKQLHEKSGVNAKSLNMSLRSMPDAYIDRWTSVPKNKYAPVWAIVPRPEHCPKPMTKTELAQLDALNADL